MPDRTLVLTMPVFEASLRVYKRDGRNADRFAGKDGHYFDVVVASFERLASAEPDRIRLVNGAGPPEAVTDSLLAALDDLL